MSVESETPREQEKLTDIEVLLVEHDPHDFPSIPVGRETAAFYMGIPQEVAGPGLPDLEAGVIALQKAGITCSWAHPGVAGVFNTPEQYQKILALRKRYPEAKLGLGVGKSDNQVSIVVNPFLEMVDVGCPTLVGAVRAAYQLMDNDIEETIMWVTVDPDVDEANRAPLPKGTPGLQLSHHDIHQWWKEYQNPPDINQAAREICPTIATEAGSYLMRPLSEVRKDIGHGSFDLHNSTRIMLTPNWPKIHPLFTCFITEVIDSIKASKVNGIPLHHLIPLQHTPTTESIAFYPAYPFVGHLETPTTDIATSEKRLHELLDIIEAQIIQPLIDRLRERIIETGLEEDISYLRELLLDNSQPYALEILHMMPWNPESKGFLYYDGKRKRVLGHSENGRVEKPPELELD